MIHIILYHPEIPQNTGNILRTAMATNSKVHIIVPIPFELNDSYEEFNEKFKDKNIYYVTKYGIHLYSEPLFENVLDDVYIMFGRESTGIDKEILSKNKEKTLRIPMLSTARSLNLSNAVAIVTYEVLKQQKFPDLATFDMIKKYKI